MRSLPGRITLMSDCSRFPGKGEALRAEMLT